jgi:hypothetical protein
MAAIINARAFAREVVAKLERQAPQAIAEVA